MWSSTIKARLAKSLGKKGEGNLLVFGCCWSHPIGDGSPTNEVAFQVFTFVSVAERLVLMDRCAQVAPEAGP